MVRSRQLKRLNEHKFNRPTTSWDSIAYSCMNKAANNDDDFEVARTWMYFPVESGIVLQMARHHSTVFPFARFRANGL